MSAVSTTTARDAGPRPGRRRLSRGRARGSRRTSGSRRSGRSRGGGDARPAGMITKTQKVDLGPGVPEKKKKKKKIAVVKEPETQYSVLNSDDYFSDISPARPISPSDNVGQGQVSEMSLGKKKKKKKDHHTSCKEFSEPEPLVCARLTESPSARNQVLDQLECLSGEKKKKRKSLSLAASQSSKLKTSPDPKQGKEVSGAGKKVKKHKKEKKTRDAIAFSTKDPWLCEAGDALYAASVEKEEAEGQVALGQKRKQGSTREHSLKKKKKAPQESDTLQVHCRHSRAVETSPGRGRKKQPVEAGVLDYISVGDSLKFPGKKKGKSKKKEEQPVGEELAVKTKKKKKRKEHRVAEVPLEEEEVSDADLEVVLEKKGNMDETYIDQVRRKALQEEIDRESGKTEASEPRKWTVSSLVSFFFTQGTQFGQWDTAGFENEEQKLKFLKLMGGFKHLSPSFNRPPNMTGRPNMALSKK
uniref:Lysine rich nucleolar protein 1 n=1 Tax=Jaculus jaculus TaxID=51337 RepID=A0A8C5K2C7_JACJA